MGYAQVKRFFHCLLFVLVTIASNGHAAEPCPPPPNDADWSAQCFESAGTERRVKPRYLRNVRFGKNGVATIRIEQTMELVAVDRRGRVIIPGIYFWGDFDFPSASDNRARFSVATQEAAGARKCGYFNARTFKIVVPAAYDHCSPFHDGQAHVCTSCARYCTDDDCHDSVYVGGTGITLDRRGKVVQTGPLPAATPRRP